MTENWIHKKTIVDGEAYTINGLNIWDFTWENTGESITIKDPQYGQAYRFNIYKIEAASQTVYFAAGEFSNNVWGIYERENQDDI